MKRKDILDALNGIDFDMVEDAEGKHLRKRNTAWLRGVAIAACLCLVLATAIVLPIALRYGGDRFLDIPEDSTSEADGSRDGTVSDTTDFVPRDDKYVNRYKFNTVDGKLYMSFNSYNVPSGEPEETDGAYGITFDSIEDFQRGVINDEMPSSVYEGDGYRELTYAEMDYIVKNFKRDENGVPILDMYNLYVPDLPDGWELGWGDDYPVVDWRDGDEYVIYISEPSRNLRATLWVLSEDDYQVQLDGSKNALGEPITVNKGNKTVTVYSESDSSGKYTLTMYVNEYAFSQRYKYIYTVYGADTVPEDNYLLSFGMRKQYASAYELEKVGDRWYMIFDSYNRYPESDYFTHLDSVKGDIWESIDKLTAVINVNDSYALTGDWSNARKLTVREMDMILWKFTRDEIGIPIFDIYNPYVPKLPDGWEVSMVEWRDGCEYVIYINDDSSSVHFLPSGTLTAQDLAAQTGTLVTDGDRTVLINISHDNDVYNVEMKAVEGELCYVYNFYGLDEIPSREYLLSFDAQRRYVSDYELKKVGDQWYIILDSRGIRPKNYDAMRIGGIGFESMSDFKYSVLNKQLSISDLEELVYWEYDDIGIPILDLYNLYTLDLTPEPEFTEEIRWMSGERYYYDHIGPDGYFRRFVCFVFDVDLEGKTPDRIIQGEGKNVEIFNLTDKYYARITEGDNVCTLMMDRGSGYTDDDLLSISMKIKKFEG